MKRWMIFGVVLLLFLLDSCEKEQDLMISLDEEVRVKLDRIYSIHPRLSFEVDQYNDSRCPRGMFCVWSGEAKVWIRIRQSMEVTTYTSQRRVLSTRGPRSFAHAGYRFELVDLTPYPDAWKEYERSEIRVVLKINRL